MGMDGEEETHLIRGSSATWSPDGKDIAFHASASGDKLPINDLPSAATTDSDIFVMNVDDSIEAAEAGLPPERTNLTAPPPGTERTKISDDADWSPDGETLIFTSKDVTDKGLSEEGRRINNYTSAEIYKIKADGTTGYDNWERLTSNLLEERAPAWSPDGRHILYSCRKPAVDLDLQGFELCVMDADGTNQKQLTFDTVPDLTANWSPDGNKIVWQRGVNQQLFVVDLIKDSNGAITGTGTRMRLTDPMSDGTNWFPTWGECTVGCGTKTK
jgi:Tol biopolymer transport system component